jgi:hypothetical protein
MQQHITYLAVLFLLCVTLFIAGCNATPDKANDTLPSEEPAPAPVRTETVSGNEGEEAVLGEEMRLEGEGFSYRPVIGYNLVNEDGAVSMEAPDAGVNTGPGFFLTGGTPEEFNAAGDASSMAMEILGTYVGAMVPEQDNFVDSPRKIARQQAVGMEVDYAVFGDAARRGRITVLVKDESQVFIMVGQSPPKLWDTEFRTLYKEVLGGVRFFEPVAVE